MIFRNGMWVMHNDSLAILVQTDGRVGLIHYVAADGTTREGLDGKTYKAHVALGELRQATHDEIPASRRPHEDVSRKLGYLRGDA